MVLTRMAAGRFDLSAEETFDGQGVTLDGEQIAFFGHSHGGLSGPSFRGHRPALGRGPPLRAGAVLIHTPYCVKTPTSLLVQAASGVNPNYLNTFHPTMNLIQMMVDATDSELRLTDKRTQATRLHVFITGGPWTWPRPRSPETLAAAARSPNSSALHQSEVCNRHRGRSDPAEPQR